jgi:hypothetical protein
MFSFISKYIPSYRASGFIVSYVSVFVILALFGYYASGKGTFMEHASLYTKQRFHSDMGYIPLPRMNISMGGGGDGGGGDSAPRLRMEIVLEVAHKDMDILSGYQPRMQEKINAYVLKLKTEDLKEKGSIVWLRAALLKQVNSAGSPVPVHDLYFQQFVMM